MAATLAPPPARAAAVAEPPKQDRGGPDGGASDNAELITLLQDAGTGWSAAVSGSQSAVTLELSSDTTVYDLTAQIE